MPALVTQHLELPELGDAAAASDQELIEAMQQWGRARRVVDAGLARLAGEVARRSSLELGYDGLAQRAGARTADILVSQLTGTTGAEARAMTVVGTMIGTPTAWMSEVATRVSAGEVSVGAAAAIQSGLGSPSPTVAADDLADAAHALLSSVGSQPPEKVARRARELRDELDEAGVADREEQLREKRFLRLTPQPDGMTRLSGLLDPESAAIVTTAVDAATSPRRAVRFADPVTEDDRTREQVAVDALVELVRIGATAGAEDVLGVARPAVRIHVHENAVSIEGQQIPASPATAHRYACAAGVVPIQFDHGDPIDVGRTQRLFTPRQRIALAARDGGCVFPGCDRPPSWCEAHHITPWSRGGPTDIRDGVLLCRHHHLLIHDNRWEITRHGTHHLLIPPADIDPARTPRPLERRPPIPTPHAA